MKVRERMSRDLAIVTPDTSIADAFQLMQDRRVRRLPVMSKNKLVGIVTIKDLNKVSPSSATSLSIFELNYLLVKTKIKDILPKNMKVITIEADANIERAAVLMREHQIGGIPVLEDGNLVGIITETNIFDAFIDILGVSRPGTRIDMEVDERVGAVAAVTGIIAQHGISIENIVLVEKELGLYDLILRLDTTEADEAVISLRHNGFKILDVIVEQ
ncbi:MAG: CBS domain-containing protein [Syntrophomonadaceae bacterium]|jgi:acetoin utilization protein AcuB|nr:CBS domain-containing protein [Syntrophomonadaceae bacterium]